MSKTIKVQQRGINATKHIITQLLDGMNESDNQPVLVVDMVPSRRAFYKDNFSTYEQC
jgi:hypothetical protein